MWPLLSLALVVAFLSIVDAFCRRSPVYRVRAYGTLLSFVGLILAGVWGVVTFSHYSPRQVRLPGEASQPISEVGKVQHDIGAPQYGTNVELDQTIRSSLKSGEIAFDVPTMMIQGKPEKAEVRITRGASDEITRLLKKDMRAPEVAMIQVTPFMIVQLRAVYDSIFAITPLTQDKQVVGDHDYTPWGWSVTPLDWGPQSLYLCVGTRFKLTGGQEETRFAPLYERTIVIKVDHAWQAKRFLSGNWKWLSTTVVFPLLVLIWRSSRVPKPPPPKPTILIP
jgi:hypothetical protein